MSSSRSLSPRASLPTHKAAVRTFYDARAPSYHAAATGSGTSSTWTGVGTHTPGNTAFHARLRDSLLTAAPPHPRAALLDMCSGTGIISLAAADAVGPDGAVVAVDCSPCMLAEARSIATEAGVEDRIVFIEGDAEDAAVLNRAREACGRDAFDGVYCSAAAVWFDDLAKTLSLWRGAVRPGGFVAFNGWSQDSFVAGEILQKVARARGWRGVPDWHGETGDMAACEAVLRDAGYVDVVVKVEDMSRWREAAELKDGFDAMLMKCPSKCEEKPFLADLFSEGQRTFLKEDYFREVDARAKEGRVRGGVLTRTIVGRVPSL